MKKKTRIIGSVSALAISMAMLTGGVLAASTVSLSVNSTVSFNATGVYLKAEGSVLRGSSTGSLAAYDGNEGGTYTYTDYSYTPVNAGTDDTPNGTSSHNLTAWTIGNVSFTETGRYLQYKIDFTNYSEFPIAVSVTDNTGTNANITKTAVSDNIEYIEPNGTQTYTLTLQLTNFSTSIENFNVSLKFDAVKTEEKIDISTAPTMNASGGAGYAAGYFDFSNLQIGSRLQLSYTGSIFLESQDQNVQVSGTKVFDVTQSSLSLSVLDFDDSRFSDASSGDITVTACILDADNNASPTTQDTVNWNCLTGDTLVTMSDGKKKRIRDVKKGDKVLSVDPVTGKLVECEVMESDIKEIKKHTCYDRWTLSDGTVIKTVHRHRFYNVEKKAYVYMDEWKIGDHFLKEDGSIVELVEHKRVNRTVRHFAITPKLHNYFANGMLNGDRNAIDVDYKAIKFNK